MSETERKASRTHPGLQRWCTRWSSDLARLAEKESRISYMESELPGLLAEAGLFAEILTTCLDEKHHPFIQTPTMFDSEFILYRDPKGGFSLRMYLWGPGCYDPVHDHNSWGVIGSVSGGLTVTTYERIDRDHSETQARLAETRSEIVFPGRTYSVLPLDEGIHRTGNPGLYTIMQVGVYGENLTGRNFINLFNESDGRIVKLFTPQVKKRMLAREALFILGGNARRE